MWGEKKELFFSGYRVSIWEDKKFWRWMVVMVAQQHELLSTQMGTKKIVEILNFVTYILSH